VPKGVGYDFRPFEEERDERLPRGLLGFLDPSQLGPYQSLYGKTGTLNRENKAPEAESVFRPDLALNRLRRSQTLSPAIVQMLTRMGELV
jgi:hypothetical protein